MALGGGAGEELGVGVGNRVSAFSRERRAKALVCADWRKCHAFVHPFASQEEADSIPPQTRKYNNFKEVGRAMKRIQQSNATDAGPCGVGDARARL